MAIPVQRIQMSTYESIATQIASDRYQQHINQESDGRGEC